MGSTPNPPKELLHSAEADLFPKNHPERADLIDGAIGEATLFNETFGYYGHAVDPELLTAPQSWQERLVPFRTPGTRGATGWCLEPHDLVLAKAAAARTKDLGYLQAALRAGVVKPELLLERLATLPADPEVLDLIRARICALQEELGFICEQ